MRVHRVSGTRASRIHSPRDFLPPSLLHSAPFTGDRLQVTCMALPPVYGVHNILTRPRSYDINLAGYCAGYLRPIAHIEFTEEESSVPSVPYVSIRAKVI